jgi:hypothetical protein
MIAGDSWAIGEWRSGKNTHGGVRQYLEEHGHQTMCFGYPGMGSMTAYDCLYSFIKYNLSKIKISKLIFFQSDWIRDIRADGWKTNDHLEVFQQGYIHTRDWYVSYLYYRLHVLYKEFGIPTIVIGGQGDTIWIDKFEQEYPGVKIGCQSFTNLVLNDNPRIDVPVHSVFKYGGTSSGFLTQPQFDSVLKYIKANSNSVDLQDLIRDMELAETRDKLFTSNKDVFPDQMHPDQKAHNKLYHYLQDMDLV